MKTWPLVATEKQNGFMRRFKPAVAYFLFMASLMSENYFVALYCKYNGNYLYKS